MLLLTCSSPAQTPADVTTQHNDTYRTGWQPNENILTPSSVNQSSFGLLWQYAVNGVVFAQPLAFHWSGSIGYENTCSNCDVVLIADEQNYVYAFEADPSSQQLLWSTSLGGDLPCLPGLPLPCGKGVIGPTIGITSTPVIDTANSIIYVAGLDMVGGSPEYYLATINLLTGAVLANVQISASFPGVSPGSSSPCTLATGTGTVTFDPTEEIQRAGLLLLPDTSAYGTVYLSFAPASSEWANGWMLGYRYNYSGGVGSLSQTYVLNTTPYGTGGGVWEGGDGLVAADATTGGGTSTFIFASTGNGTFDWNTPKNNYGDTLLRLNPGGLAISDFFTPADELTYPGSPTGRCLNDVDFDSGGLIALPDETPPLMPTHPHLMIAADKEAKLYVVDRDNLTQHHTPTDLIVQEIRAPSASNVLGYWGYPAYYRWTNAGSTYRALYYSVREQFTSSPPLPINQYILNSTGPIPSSYPYYSTTEIYCGYGAAPSVSSNGSTGGILWAVESTNIDNPSACLGEQDQPGTDYRDVALHAYDATNISIELYNGRGHNAGNGYHVKFETPTVFNGKVFAGARNETDTGGLVDVWGLCTEGSGGKCLE